MTETNIIDTTKHVFEIYIRTTPERLWQALTDGEITQKYFFGTRVESDWQSGAEYAFYGAGPDGEEMKMVDGEVLEIDPPHRLAMSFHHYWSGDVEYPMTKLIWEITPMGDVCRLVLVHQGLEAGHQLTGEFFTGWSMILSGLKSYLETGEPLVVKMGE